MAEAGFCVMYQRLDVDSKRDKFSPSGSYLKFYYTAFTTSLLEEVNKRYNVYYVWTVAPVSNSVQTQGICSATVHFIQLPSMVTVVSSVFSEAASSWKHLPHDVMVPPSIQSQEISI